MFDFANSSYTTVIVTVAFGVYFTKLVAPARLGDWYWGLGMLMSNLLAVVVSPLIGAMADDGGRKKAFLAATWLACVAATAALWFVYPGAVVLGLTLFVASNLAYSLGENLAAAFLPELSTPENIGRVSGFGWGLGYFGGLASLLVVAPLLKGGFTISNLPHLQVAWLVTAAFFFLAGLPTFLVMRERAPRGPKRRLWEGARRGLSRLRTSTRAIRHFSELGRFLIVFFVFSCGLMTVIAFAGIFAARTLHFSASELMLLFILLQVSSALGAFLFGWLEDRIGTWHLIQGSLVFWTLVCVGSAWCPSKGVFWMIAMVAGLGVGSLQSAARGLVGLFSPLSKSGEFFAFWGLAGKGAYALGPLVFGAISSASGSERVAILATAVFFVAGFIGMFWVDEERGHKAALAWSASESE